MRPNPAHIAGRVPPPAQQLMANLEANAHTPLTHADIVALAYTLEERDHLPIAAPWASALRTAVWTNHKLLRLEEDRLVPTQRAFDAIAAWAEKSVDPSTTHDEPDSPIANGKAGTRDTVPGPGNPTIAVAHATTTVRDTSAHTTQRVGLAAVSSAGRWSMINFQVRVPRHVDHADAATDHALRAIMNGARLHPGPCQVLTADPKAARVVDRWNGGTGNRPPQVLVTANASTVPLGMDHVRAAITGRRSITARALDHPSGHPLYEVALSLAQASAEGSEKQKGTGRPWSHVAPDMATSAARAWSTFLP